MAQLDEVLRRDEQDAIIMALANGVPSFTEEEASRVMEWARDARVSATLLKLVLDGRVAIFFRDGEVAFKTPERSQE